MILFQWVGSPVEQACLSHSLPCENTLTNQEVIAVGLLTIYDMLKAADRGMLITDVGLLRKEGGRSGTWVRGEQAPDPA